VFGLIREAGLFKIGLETEKVEVRLGLNVPVLTPKRLEIVLPREPWVGETVGLKTKSNEIAKITIAKREILALIVIALPAFHRHKK